MSDTMKEYIAEAEADLLHTYNRYQIVLDKGDGVYLYDIDGKKYLDFVAGKPYLHWDIRTKHTTMH